MKYYFDNIEKQHQLKRLLDEWIGTPFRHHAGVKGRGCDCIHFVTKIFEELGVIQWRKDLIPDYPRDWHLHNTRELLMEGILKELPGEKVELSSLKNGDIILSHYGKAASHASIYYDGYIYQSITDMGVCKINFNDRVFRRQMKFGFRITG